MGNKIQSNLEEFLYFTVLVDMVFQIEIDKPFGNGARQLQK